MWHTKSEYPVLHISQTVIFNRIKIISIIQTSICLYIKTRMPYSRNVKNVFFTTKLKFRQIGNCIFLHITDSSLSKIILNEHVSLILNQHVSLFLCLIWVNKIIPSDVIQISPTATLLSKVYYQQAGVYKLLRPEPLLIFSHERRKEIYTSM